MRPYYYISSLAKGFKIIELLSKKGEMTASNVSSYLNTSRAAGHRFLMTLCDLGYVEKTANGRFRLTFKVLELGMRKLDSFEIRHTVRPFMQQLSMAFGETVNLGYWDGKIIMHLDKISSTEILRLDVEMGTGAPAYCTALGKAILAFLPQHELDNYFNSVQLVKISPKTITSKEKLKTEIEAIRQCGYAVDDEELSLGLRCVAAPIFDHTGKSIFALSVSGLTQRITPKKIEAIQTELRPLCRQISRLIGAPDNGIT